MSYYYSDWIEHSGDNCPVEAGKVYHCETFSGGTLTIYGAAPIEHRYWIYSIQEGKAKPAYQGVPDELCIKRYRQRESSSFNMLEEGARTPDLSKIVDFGKE